MKAYKFTKFTMFVLLPLLTVINGCAFRLGGIGQDGGELVNENGQLQKTYKVDYVEAVKASLIFLNSLKFTGGLEIEDELKTTIKAVQKDGTHVTIDVVRIEDGLTSVSVNMGTGDFGDRQAPQKIMDSIDKELIRDSSTHLVILKPSKKKVVIKSSARPAAVLKTDTRFEPESSQQISQVTREKGKGNKEQDKPENTVVATTEIRDQTIYFKNNSNVLPIEEAEKLNRVAAMISRHPKSGVILKGYPDSFGNPEYDMMLSLNRATAVKFYLMGKGINPDNITMVAPGKGGTSPAGGEMPLRRVEIEIEDMKDAD